MPSASVLSAYTFSNLGPLTTTFTPPASCQSLNPFHVYIAPSSLPVAKVADATCAVDPDYWSCRPTGTVTNLPSDPSYWSNPRVVYQQQYHSPGLYCPSGWHEVGVASRDGSKPVDWNGVFSPATPVPTTNANIGVNPPANVLMQLLDPSETAVICCPTSMTAEGEAAGCYSTLPDYKISTACNRILPFQDVSAITTELWVDGVTVEAHLQTLVSDLPVTQTIHQSFHPSEASSYVGVTSVAPVTLVHQPTDLAKTNAASKTPAAATTTTTTTTNAASALNSRPSIGNQLVGILGLTTAAMVLGAAIVL